MSEATSLQRRLSSRFLMGEMEPDEGTYKWGVTTSQAYFPKDSTAEFDNDHDDCRLADPATLRIKDVTYVRGFLGRMLFAGEDGVKKVKVLIRWRKGTLSAFQDDDQRCKLYWFSMNPPTTWIWSPSLP